MIFQFELFDILILWTFVKVQFTLLTTDGSQELQVSLSWKCAKEWWLQVQKQSESFSKLSHRLQSALPFSNNMCLKQLSCKFWHFFKNVWCQRNDCGVTKQFCWHGRGKYSHDVFWGIIYLRTVCYCNRGLNPKRERCPYILIHSLYFTKRDQSLWNFLLLEKFKHQKYFSLICFANTRCLSGATGLIAWRMFK